MPTETTILAWHFLREDRRLQYPPHALVEEGRTLTVEGPPILCRHGFHAARRIIDSLNYAPGPVVCRVRIGGKIIDSDDKLVGTSRKVLWMFDATKVLHEFAIRVAEQALQSARVIDPLCHAAIHAKRDWLAGRINDDQLRAARDMVWNAAWSSTGWGMANAVAWSAANPTPTSAAWDAAWDAACCAAADASPDASPDAAAMKAHNALLESMIAEARHAADVES